MDNIITLPNKMAAQKNLPQLPGYRIISHISSGGIADVYSGVQEKSSLRVAIKMLKPQVIKNQETARRFLKEAETSKKLNHPNIIKVYEIIFRISEYYLVMEYLEKNLRDKIKSTSGSFLSPEDWKMLEQVARALEYAHRKGVIHRDVKPENIMFRPDNTPVLADFGLAKLTDSSEKLTKSGITVGTPDYMSPEQIEGLLVDGRTDIYSLGIVLYEMLTGETPYKAKNYVTLAMKHLRKKIPRLPRLLKKYQPLLNQMMAKDRDQRINNSTELIQIIEHHRQLFFPE